MARLILSSATDGPPTHSLARLDELDVVRGLLLVNIMLNHLPGSHTPYTSQPLGFVSSAEGFFLISSYLLGSITARRASEGKPLFDRLWKRLRLIYLAHVLTLGIVFVVIGLGLSELPSYYNIVRPYLEHDAGMAVWSALLLLYQPPLLDILPLYICFMLATPALWHIAQRSHWLLVFAGSAALWLWAQFVSMNAVLAWATPELIVQWGSFHLLGWQLLWVSGFGFGVWHWRYRTQGKQIQIPQWLGWLALALAIFLFAWRMPIIWPEIDLGDYWLVGDKWSFGPLRVGNFLLLLLVVFHFAPLWCRLLKPLAFFSILGRHSLLVFSVHAVFGLLLAGWVELIQPSQAVRLLLVGAQVSLIFIWTRRLELQRKAAVHRVHANR